MWFLILLFIVLGAIGVLFRSPKMLLGLAVTFSFIAMLYTPWWPIVMFLIGGVGYIIYLDRKETQKEDQRQFREAVKREIQQEVEIGSMIKSMKKHDKRM